MAPPAKHLSTSGALASGTISRFAKKSRPNAAKTETPSEGSNGEKVKVFVRVRPVSEKESAKVGQGMCLQQIATRGLSYTDGEKVTRFRYDAVLGSETTQEAVYEKVGAPLVDSVMAGYNACCFSHGALRAGRTHTMLGDIDPDLLHHGPNSGLVPRVFHGIFERTRELNSAGAQFSCTCSFLEIYNEALSDLLVPADESDAKPEIQCDALAGVCVANATEVVVDNMEQAMDLFRRGAANCVQAEQGSRRRGSRSHAVFILKVASTTEGGKQRCSTLTMVTPAGSEVMQQQPAGDSSSQLASEGVDHSLATLTRVVNALAAVAPSARPPSSIPYGDSQLSLLLRDGLGGNCRTSIIANVSPSSHAAADTLATLQFAEAAATIRNTPSVNRAAAPLCADVVLRASPQQQLCTDAGRRQLIADVEREELQQLMAEQTERGLQDSSATVLVDTSGTVPYAPPASGSGAQDCDDGPSTSSTMGSESVTKLLESLMQENTQLQAQVKELDGRLKETQLANSREEANSGAAAAADTAELQRMELNMKAQARRHEEAMRVLKVEHEEQMNVAYTMQELAPSSEELETVSAAHSKTVELLEAEQRHRSKLERYLRGIKASHATEINRIMAAHARELEESKRTFAKAANDILAQKSQSFDAEILRLQLDSDRRAFEHRTEMSMLEQGYSSALENERRSFMSRLEIAGRQAQPAQQAQQANRAPPAAFPRHQADELTFRLGPKDSDASAGASATIS